MTDIPMKRPWWKHWWGILLVLFFVLFGLYVGYFFQQFFKFYGMAKRGELSATPAFAARFTASEILRASVPQTATSQMVTTPDDPRIGTDGAPLVIVEFADFGCPYSREVSFVIRELATRYTDKLLYIYRDFPLDDVHPQARAAAEAGECARELGNFWAFHDKLYQNQDRLSREDLIQYGREIGLEEVAFVGCMDSRRYRDEVEKDYQDGIAAGVQGTPTFFFNGLRIEGSIPREVFERLVESVGK